ncbi:MAG: hypothetical protein ACI8Y4_002341, partial [Candidatus Poriferisodalaceae bacterium]
GVGHGALATQFVPDPRSVLAVIGPEKVNVSFMCCAL